MSRKILVLDLDGTLTNSQKEVTEPTKKAIRRMQEQGHIVALASGRPTAGIRPVAEALDMERTGGYVLAFNGARVIDWKEQKVLFQQTLGHEYLQTLYEAAVRHGLTIFTYQGSQAITATKVNEYAEFEARINRLTIQQVEDFAGYVDFPVNKCLLSGDPKDIKACEDELLEALGDKLSIFKSEDFFLEIMAQNIDKATSLHRLVTMLGMKQEDTVCCGDGYNDISMIRYAGVGVAMENAKDVVKEAADVIAGSNDADGLVPIIEQYILNVNEK